MTSPAPTDPHLPYKPPGYHQGFNWLGALTIAVRIFGIILLAFGTWTLPTGDRLWLVALIIPAYPLVTSGALRPRHTLPLAPLGLPAPIWYATGGFAGVLPNYERLCSWFPFLPGLDWPYRPTTLYVILSLLVAFAYLMAARHLTANGWTKPRALVVAVVSWVLAIASAAVALVL